VSAPAPYASGTTVSAEKSRLELEGLLAKHGATQRAVFTDDARGIVAIAFVIADHKYRLDVPLPNRSDYSRPKKWPHGWQSWSLARREQWAEGQCAQAQRERWRAVVLACKAKLELVRLGVSTIEREFLADLVLPDGKTASETLGEYMRGILANGYRAPLALPPAGIGRTTGRGP
jgi:hypothetical protein